MAFIFSTSHLPESRVRRPDHLEDEEDDDVMQPMPRAGGVRAFSHLPVRDNPAPSTAPLREDSPRREIGPIPPRSATPSTSGSPMAEAQDDAPPPEADSDHNPEDDTAPQDHADDRPWYMPRITAQDLPPQDHPEDAHAPAPKPWENTTRSSRFDGAPPADRSATTTRDNGFAPSPQGFRDAFHSTAPDSPAGKAPTQENRPTQPGGRIFEQRSAPEAFLTQQMGKGASGLPQQRLQGSERILAAQQQQQPVGGATPTAPGGRLAAQQQAQPPAAAPAQNVPAAPQPPAAGKAKRKPCADCQAKLDAALQRLCELEAEEYAIRAEIGRQFKIIQEAEDEWFAAYRRGDDAAGKAAIRKEARATTTIERLNDSLFKPGSEKIFIEREIEALRSCIHSDPFELQ